ncbi:inorganic phosphate transporter [Saccharicrinis aurantiacus]|uniref:inorganic phosphate transporter n=1 Tax=Saccharicrinis aurantiacus TaxID=1849719 RepID=UPI002491A6BB|nr:inorganic phosphate transporter [Saccharicrinis aurantiacus]
MDQIYLIVFILVLLGFIDLIVGLSNDAVNFLSAAIGSKVAKRKVIYLVAGIGIIAGCLLSGGMMEVARKGVFYPQNFYLTELIILFLAVMIVDIILVDVYNTFGFPTSTTVAIIFELLGGALAIGLIVISGDNPNNLVISDLINTHSVFIIVGGILFSIVFAFLSGAIFQFIARLIFSFRYKKRFKFLFSLVGALAITAILFMVIKKEGAFADIFYGDLEMIINQNLVLALGIIYAISLLIFLVLSFVFNADIPKIVVFFGTFALALSFAANDLVNFIGVPLSGIEGLMAFAESDITDPALFSMNIWGSGYLNQSLFHKNWYPFIFLGSGLVMMITLFVSRKARSVTETEVYLGRQDSGYEPFEPSHTSRAIVRNYFIFYEKVKSVIPVKVANVISKQFKRDEFEEDISDNNDIVYFDTIRASVNLVVASIFIGIGTYFRFPLSTTFVVFMVAMGTSLSDQAWGRDSAVYRISGVLSVLGGWFLTALIAFIASFLIVLILWWGKLYALFPLLVAVGYVLYRTTKSHRKAEKEKHLLKVEAEKQLIKNVSKLVDLASERIRKQLLESSKIFILVVQGFVDENSKQLKEATERIDYLDKLSQSTKKELFNNFSFFGEEHFESSHFFVQAMDYISELVSVLKHLTKPIVSHVDNHHKGLSNSQQEDILLLLEEITGFFNYLVHIEKEHRFDSMDEIIQRQQYLGELIIDLRKKQIKRIMDGNGKTRGSILLLECYAETKNLVLYTINLIKAHRDFYQSSQK